MRSLRCLLLVAVLGARALPAQRAYTLDELLERALSGNLDLRAARLRADSARAEIRVARGWPNPTASLTPANPYQFTVGAPVDLGPQRLYRVRAAQRGATASVSDVRDAERQVRFAVRAAFFDLVLADTVRDVAREERDIFLDLLAADSARVRAGSAPESNLVKSELELAKAEAALAAADAAVRTARVALQAAAGITRPDTGFRVSGSLMMQPLPALDGALAPASGAAPAANTAAALGDSAVDRRADVEAARWRTRASEAARSFATAQLLPVPELALVHQTPEPFPNGQHYAVGVGAQLPVWNWFSGERARARSAVEQARVAEVRTRAQAWAEVSLAADQFRATTLVARRLDGRLLEKSRGALETARYAYRAGAVSYLELREAVRTYGQIRAAVATAGHDYWVSAYAVARALDREVVAP